MTLRDPHWQTVSAEDFIINTCRIQIVQHYQWRILWRKQKVSVSMMINYWQLNSFLCTLTEIVITSQIKMLIDIDIEWHWTVD